MDRPHIATRRIVEIGHRRVEGKIHRRRPKLEYIQQINQRPKVWFIYGSEKNGPEEKNRRQLQTNPRVETIKREISNYLCTLSSRIYF